MCHAFTGCNRRILIHALVFTQRKEWTLDDDEEDDAKSEEDVQAVAELDSSLPLPPIPSADDDEEVVGQTSGKRQRLESAPFGPAPTTSSSTSTTTATATTATAPTATAESHAATNGATSASNDIDPLDEFMNSMLADVDYVPVVSVMSVDIVAPTDFAVRLNCVSMLQADIRPLHTAGQTKMVIHEGAPTAQVITLEDIMNRRQLVRVACFSLCARHVLLIASNWFVKLGGGWLVNRRIGRAMSPNHRCQVHLSPSKSERRRRNAKSGKGESLSKP